jgi:cobalt-zinc-cadmium efflux system outer membrane protein
LTLFLALTTALTIVLPGPAGAQQPVAATEPSDVHRISLAEAVRLFQANNLELRLALEEHAAAEARVAVAGMFPNPGLTATREQLSGVNEVYHETIFAIAQRLEIGGQRGARLTAARRGAAAAAAHVEVERLRLEFDVHRAYVRGAVALADLSVLGEATEVFRRVEESGSVRFAEGDISRFDRNRLQIERARYETLLARAALETEEASRELALLVQPDSIGDGRGLLAAEPLGELGAVAPSRTLDAALAAAVERPEVRAAAAEVEAAMAALSLVRRERIPDLTVSGGFKHQADGFQGAVVGLTLPLPLWNRNRGGVAEAQALADAALARRELALRRAQNDIRRAWDTQRSLQERMRTLGETLLPESAGLLETARVAYGEGEMSLIELLDAADAYRSARESVNHLLGDYLIALYDLQRATGRLPDLEPTPLGGSSQ